MDDIAAGGAPGEEPGAPPAPTTRKRGGRAKDKAPEPEPRTTARSRSRRAEVQPPTAEEQPPTAEEQPPTAEEQPAIEPTIPGIELAAPARRTRRKAAGTTEPDEPAAAVERPATKRGRRGVSRAEEGSQSEDVTRAEEEAGTVEPPAPALATPPRMAPSTALLFMAPEPEAIAEAPEARRARRRGPEPSAEPVPAEAEPAEPRRTRRPRAAAEPTVEEEPVALTGDEGELDEDERLGTGHVARRRRGRRGRGRGRGLEADETVRADVEPAAETAPEAGPAEEEPLTRRRRRRRRGAAAAEAEGVGEDGVVTVVRVRAPRDEVQGVAGSTRLEAKRQRRRDGREQRRTRPPILTEAEFLARREAVDRVMVVRQRNDRTQVAVLEDGILVEHYVARQSATTIVGNVYLGKVQNVLPSMEAAFVDIGRGRNAVLYAGEVNWDATGLEGKNRSIEQALKSGDPVLVQVTKDPVGHKGARLTSHIALSGRHLVYVPNGHASGISRKLSDVERRRLRDVLKNLVPDGAGVIVRTAAEGASEEDLARDVKRLQAQWEDIQAKAAAGGAPALLSAEPDLVIRVVRDLFNEDFREIVIQGSDAHDKVEQYLAHVSPDLVGRVRQHTGPTDAFAEWRIDEQILKGLDRRVFLPSGGHLVIDRTEAMTVIDVNTGKYTGAGGNLEETVTRNNLEAAEEIVRQLRLRDVGGIVVIDFIDMVLESNRELVLRRLTECLGRDRTKHQVTEITSLGLVQMTRKRIGQGLLESFSETCDHCKGRGVIIQTEPVPERPRPNIAEKVRAVAASTRLATTESQAPVAPAVEGGTDADDATLADVALAEAGLPGDVAVLGIDDAEDVDGGEEATVLDVDMGEHVGPDDDRGIAGDLADASAEAEPTARRRARRGSSRRRTRP